MTIAEMNAVSRMIQLANVLLQHYGNIATLNELFNGAANYDGVITTEMLQTIPAFAHLSQADLSEMAYVIGVVLGALSGNLGALSNLTTGE